MSPVAIPLCALRKTKGFIISPIWTHADATVLALVLRLMILTQPDAQTAKWCATSETELWIVNEHFKLTNHSKVTDTVLIKYASLFLRLNCILRLLAHDCPLCCFDVLLECNPFGCLMCYSNGSFKHSFAPDT